jgi:hypothetical protein
MDTFSHKYHNLYYSDELKYRSTLEKSFDIQTIKRDSRNLPIHRGSDIKAILLFGPTSMQSLPSLFTGQDFLHSWRHFFGLHRSELTIAIRVWASSPLPSVPEVIFFFGGMVIYFF